MEDLKEDPPINYIEMRESHKAQSDGWYQHFVVTYNVWQIICLIRGGGVIKYPDFHDIFYHPTYINNGAFLARQAVEHNLRTKFGIKILMHVVGGKNADKFKHLTDPLFYLQDEIIQSKFRFDLKYEDEDKPPVANRKFAVKIVLHEHSDGRLHKVAIEISLVLSDTKDELKNLSIIPSSLHYEQVKKFTQVFNAAKLFTLEQQNELDLRRMNVYSFLLSPEVAQPKNDKRKNNASTSKSSRNKKSEDKLSPVVWKCAEIITEKPIKMETSSNRKNYSTQTRKNPYVWIADTVHSSKTNLNAVDNNEYRNRPSSSNSSQNTDLQETSRNLDDKDYPVLGLETRTDSPIALNYAKAARKAQLLSLTQKIESSNTKSKETPPITPKIMFCGFCKKNLKPEEVYLGHMAINCPFFLEFN